MPNSFRQSIIFLLVTTFVLTGLQSLQVMANDHGKRQHLSEQLKIHGRPGKMPNHDHPRPPMHNGKHQPVMQQTLFLLLAEKYSPQSLTDWRSTIATHNHLRAQIQQLARANPRLAKSLRPQHTEDLKVKLETDMNIRKQFQQAVISKNQVAIQYSLASVLKQLEDRNKLLSARLVAMRKTP